MGVGSAALVLLPVLISGYVFSLIFRPLRYFSTRADGQRFFFMAAGAGAALAATTFYLTGAYAAQPGFSEGYVHAIAASIDSYIPIPHACRLLLTMFVAVGLAGCLNFLLSLALGGWRSRRRASKVIYDKLTDKFGTPMSQLFRKAADRQKLVLLNLKSRKYYCGRIFEVPPTIDEGGACIELLPLFSGHRNKDTLDFGEKRTDYPVIALWEAQRYLSSCESALDEFDAQIRRAKFDPENPLIARKRAALVRDLEEAKESVSGSGGSIDFDPLDWVKVIPVSEIESASFYDPSANEVWFNR